MADSAEICPGRHLLFVYGTLKREQPNANQLGIGNGLAELKGSAITIELYPLVVASQYNIPFLIPKPSAGHAVKGEVYEVDDQMLKHCDAFEGHPDWYERKEIDVYLISNDKDELLHQQQELTCWCYFLKDYESSLLDLPMLDNYVNTPEKPYVAKYERDAKNGAFVKDGVCK